jgi:hypothetical protein
MSTVLRPEAPVFVPQQQSNATSVVVDPPPPLHTPKLGSVRRRRRRPTSRHTTCQQHNFQKCEKDAVKNPKSQYTNNRVIGRTTRHNAHCTTTTTTTAYDNCTKRHRRRNIESDLDSSHRENETATKEQQQQQQQDTTSRVSLSAPCPSHDSCGKALRCRRQRHSRNDFRVLPLDMSGNPALSVQSSEIIPRPMEATLVGMECSGFTTVSFPPLISSLTSFSKYNWDHHHHHHHASASQNSIWQSTCTLRTLVATEATTSNDDVS